MVMEGIQEDMGDGNIICTNHPYKNNTPGGICAFCLQEKLGKLVSSSFPSPIFPSSSSSSTTPSFRSDFGNTSCPTTTTTTTTTSSTLQIQTNISQTTNSNIINSHYERMRKSRIPFYLTHKKKNKAATKHLTFTQGSSTSVISTTSATNAGIVMKRSKSTTTPRNNMHFLDNEEDEDYTPHKKRFWSFLYYSSSKNTSKKPEKLVKDLSLPSSTSSMKLNDKKKEEFVVVEENGSPNEAAFDRKVSRSRSVGCGSRSFSGDFFERISTGFGDCTLRRVESQREGKSKVVSNGANGQDCIKERVRCGGLFSGFMITSSSSSSSSSSHWVSSEENVNGKSSSSTIAPGSVGHQLVHGRSNKSWGWAFASPMRAFSSKSSSWKRGASNNKNATPNLAAIPSLLTARG